MAAVARRSPACRPSESARSSQVGRPRVFAPVVGDVAQVVEGPRHAPPVAQRLPARQRRLVQGHGAVVLAQVLGQHARPAERLRPRRRQPSAGPA